MWHAREREPARSVSRVRSRIGAVTAYLDRRLRRAATALASVGAALAASVIAAAILVAPAGAAESTRDTLVVATKEAPPFVLAKPNGGHDGIAVWLWNEIASDLDRPYRWVELPLDSLLAGIAGGRIDVGVGAITITDERERRLDFTHAFYSTGLGVATAGASAGPMRQLARIVAAGDLWRALLTLCIVLFAVGVVVWLFESRANREQFGGRPWHGIGSGFWWAAVTMTTVGYGDKAPQTLGGRTVGFVWMFVAIITISSLTAAIASSLTAAWLDAGVQSVGDLNGLRVGSLRGATGERAMIARGIEPRTYPDVRSGLSGLLEGEIDAFVHDAPVLRFRVNQFDSSRLRVAPFTFEPQSYGFALAPRSPLREELNRSLLRTVSRREWRSVVDRYLGP